MNVNIPPHPTPQSYSGLRSSRSLDKPIYTSTYFRVHNSLRCCVVSAALKRKVMARPPSESPAGAKHRAAKTRRAMPLRPWMQAEIPMAHGNPAAKNDESPVDKNHGNNSEKIYNVFSVSNESVNIWDKSDKFNHWWREKTLHPPVLC